MSSNFEHLHWAKGNVRGEVTCRGGVHATEGRANREKGRRLGAVVEVQAGHDG